MLMLDMSLFRSNFHCGIIDKSLAGRPAETGQAAFCLGPSGLRAAQSLCDGCGPWPGWERESRACPAWKKKGNGNPVRWRAAAWLSPMGAMCGWGLICEGEPCSFSMFPSWRMFPCMLRGEPGKSVRGQSIQFPGGFILKESTHEGGRYGVNYELTRQAMENMGKSELSPWISDSFFQLV